MPEQFCGQSSGAVSRGQAQHVRVALGQTAQAPRSSVQPKALEVRRPVAPHVQAATGAVQLRRPGPVIGNHPVVAAHVRAASASVQAKLSGGVVQCAKVKLYHATTATNANSILQQGLLVKKGGEGIGLSTHLGTKKDSEGRIFFMGSLNGAKNLKKFGTVEVVIEAELDDSIYTITENDGSMGGTYITQDVPAHLLTVVWPIDFTPTVSKKSTGGCVIL